MRSDLANRTNQGQSLIYERILCVSSAIATVLILGWILKYSKYGFDFTDESFYLVWISNPFLYDWSISQFGFVYHPLYLMLKGDIASIRQVNVLITFVLSWVFVSLILSGIGVKDLTQKVTQIVVAAGYAVTSLIAFDSWLLTPSYNSLNFQALLISAIGLLLAEPDSTKISIFGWSLIGIGGCLAFLAKPSTALALAVGVLVYLRLSRKFSLHLSLISIISALVPLVIFAVLIDGSLYKFVDRLRTGIQFAGYLEGGYSVGKIIRLDSFRLSTSQKAATLLVAALAFFSTWSMHSENKLQRVMGFLVAAAFLTLVITFTFDLIHGSAAFGRFQGLMVWAIVFASSALTLVTLGKKALALITRSQWILALLFLIMPHIFAFGTNRNYWFHGCAVALFWLLIGVILLCPMARMKKGWGFTLPLVIATQAITATLVQAGLEKPYRQPQPLRLNESLVEIGDAGSKLILSAGYANYLENAKRAARIAGLKQGVPVIDLTGQSPGILYALQAQSIGQAWMIGGYSGSQQLAIAALSRVHCEQTSIAWLLAEPDGPRSISKELLAAIGSNLSEDYEQVASWLTAEGAGDYVETREQVLYKPLKPVDVLRNCLRLRNKESF